MKELYSALHEFQGKLRGVKKDSQNPHFKNRYASLEKVIDTIRPIMQELGLIWYQYPGVVNDGAITVTTVIAHVETQQCIEMPMEMPLAKRDPQGAGSALTYAMRYSLMAALGLPPTDDDAETAIDRDNERTEEKPKSSAQLKRDGAWEKVMEDLTADFLDTDSFGKLEALKATYRERAKKEGWNKAFTAALKDQFAAHEEQLSRENPPIGETVSDIQNTFPGSQVTNEIHPPQAG